MASHPAPASEEPTSIWTALNVVLALIVGGFTLYWGVFLFFGALGKSFGSKNGEDQTPGGSASPTAPAFAAAAPNPGQQSPTTPAQVPKASGQPPPVAGQAAAASAPPPGVSPAAMAGANTIEITLKPDVANPLAYDIKEFAVKAGNTVRLTFNNVHPTVPQPHNVVIGRIGTKDALMAAAMQMATSPDGMAKGFIPESADVLAHTKLLQPNTMEVIEFTAPPPGDYPYLCTFPGHAILMNGVMHVE